MTSAAISSEDLDRLARLAGLELPADGRQSLATELGSMLALLARLQAVDTAGIEPLAHPLAVREDIHLRLRDDVAVPASTTAERDALMANAPARQDGLFLVPQVIE